MPLILPGNVGSAVAGAYEVANSCRFNDGDSPSMKKTFSSASRTTWTFSCWFKRGNLGITSGLLWSGTSNNDRSGIFINSDDTIRWFSSESSAQASWLSSNRKLRDPSAFYHFVCRYDTTQSTESDRIRFYLNGEQLAMTSGTPDYPAEDNASSYIGSDDDHFVGCIGYGTTTTEFFDGYLAEVVFCDGQSLAATSFGEFDSDSPTIWKPIDVSGLTFGTNGFYCDFEASDNLGNDANGGTDLTESGLAAIDQCVDSPTNNFSTWNVLNKFQTNSAFSQGNNLVDHDDTSTYVSWSTNNIGMTAGKWYMEMQVTTLSSSLYTMVGVTGHQDDRGDASADAYSFNYYSNNGNKYNEGDQGSYGDSWTADDYISIALDLDNLKVYFAKNGTWQDSGDPTSGATGTGAAFTVDTPSATHKGAYFFKISDHGNGGSVAAFNFGNGSFGETSAGATNADDNGYGIFKYDVPAGYLALCTKNLGSDGG